MNRRPNAKPYFFTCHFGRLRELSQGTALPRFSRSENPGAAGAMPLKSYARHGFTATERTTATAGASLQTNAMLSAPLHNGNNNDENKGERIQKLRQTINVLQAHVWIGKCWGTLISRGEIDFLRASASSQGLSGNSGRHGVLSSVSVIANALRLKKTILA
jgi:hypothetical protein